VASSRIATEVTGPGRFDQCCFCDDGKAVAASIFIVGPRDTGLFLSVTPAIYYPECARCAKMDALEQLNHEVKRWLLCKLHKNELMSLGRTVFQ